MATKTTLSADAVKTYLANSMKPKTTQQVANKFKVSTSAARRTLNALVSTGLAFTDGKTDTGSQGRPATLFNSYSF